MPQTFDPTLWTPIGPGEDPRGTRFDTPFGVVEGRWWPNRIQIFHVRPVLAPPAAPDQPPTVGERTESFGSLPRIGALPTGCGPALVSARAADLVRQAGLWLGPAAHALEVACILALRALARQAPNAAGHGDPGLLEARFSTGALTFNLAIGGFPPGSVRSGLPGWHRTAEARARYDAALKAAHIRPDGLLPALRRLRRISDGGILEPRETLLLALPSFATAHARIAAFHGAEARLREAGADLDRLARDNRLAPLLLETP